MNPYSYYHHTNLQRQQPYYAYGFPISPVPVLVPPSLYDPLMIPANSTGTTYPPYMEYVDGIAILDTPNTTRLIRQPNHTSVPYRRRSIASFLGSSRSMLRNPLEVGSEPQRLNASYTSGGGGSGLSKKKISKHLHVYMAAQRKKMVENSCEGDEEVNDSCCICLCEYEKEEKMGILECGHQYHAKCIKRWLLSKNVCPMCRSIALTV